VITIFHLISCAAFITGGVLGWRVGFAFGGVAGGLIAAAVGAYVGLIIGRIPGVLTVRSVLRSLRRTATAELRAQLEDQYYVSHLIIAELVSRGEPLESFRTIVEHQLTSSNPDVQRFGRANASMWFPELVGGPAAG
jgi:hypothetical protein